ncbi:MAG: sensor histidine kinase [Leptospiraceae bacterium]|nr:sensor histidine kinase [Leptospiraceae bacterium]
MRFNSKDPLSDTGMVGKVGAAILLILVLPIGAIQADCPAYFSGRGDLGLSGQWKVMPAAISGGERPALNDAHWKTISLPFVWSDVPALQNYRGDLWLRCRIVLSGGSPPEHAALFLGRVRDSDQVYFNGIPIGRTGTLEPFEPDLESTRIYAIPYGLWQEDNILAIHLRGTTSGSGILGNPRIADHGTLLTENMLSTRVAAGFSFLFLFLSLYFFTFVIFTSRKKENLFLGLFTLSLGFYHLIRSGYRYVIFEHFVFSYQVELICLFLLPILFLNFFVSWINYERPLLLRILEIAYALLTALVISIPFFAPERAPFLFDVAIYVNLLGVAIVLVFGISLFARTYGPYRDRLRFIGIGFICLVPPVLNDMLTTMGVIHTPRILVFAFPIFLGFIALQLSDGIIQLNSAIKEQEKELRQLERKKTGTILNISQEFQHLFEGIKKLLDQAPEKKDGRAKNKSNRDLDCYLTNLENLILDSRLLSQLENNEYPERHVRFNLMDQMKLVVDRASRATQSRAGRVTVHSSSDEMIFRGDPELFHAMMYHLVENGLLYSESDVEVRLVRDERAITITVRDEGPGIPSDQQDRIFEKFVRGSDDHSVAGSGIGLTIVDEIAGRMGASLRLDSGPGFYTSIELYIPQQEAA